MTSIRLPIVSTHPGWSVARFGGVALTFVLLLALVLWPQLALHVLWDMVIPLLPAVFLVNPMLWRNVCPLATLNTIGGTRRRSAPLKPSLIAAGTVVGIALLALMVPARRFFFNEHGASLAVAVSAVAVLAFASGLLAPRRSGFCNSLCPVLPVEKLYGQSPLWLVGSARCADCSRCTVAGCIDLAGRRSAMQSVAGRRNSRWVASPFGAFACGFPGFVYGYFTTENSPLAMAPGIYGHVAFWSFTSLVIMSVLVLISGVRASIGLVCLGGISAATYYWFASPGLAVAYGGGPTAGFGLRVISLALVGFWFWRAVRREVGSTRA